ncbi:MBL fold metallo-hydrolase RNA specificity domain-containing protein [Thiohalophilus sp.]|uniref:MBL fold metallo-hydrolase RNA specificity domain-containing protein n=1 Tax=Thiohalophilus sp. TaxID=3028392 RepID=UPI0039751997
MATLQFLGATGEVTGSAYLIRTDRSTLLLECGLHQGRGADQANEAPFVFSVAEIDAVVLSHAHLDHSGLLPKLVKEGYRGPIYMTRATHDLIEIMLHDAAFLQMKDTEWENKQRKRAGKSLLEPLYTDKDVENTLQLHQTLDYRQRTPITPDIQLQYHDAGHILGSAIVELTFDDSEPPRRLVFSGDLGNIHHPLLQDPAFLQQADTLMLESTYGDHNHRSYPDTVEEFYQALQAANDAGGNVLIPSFAVGRTQEILFWLGKFYRQGRLSQQQIFLDSPMAISASELYFRYLHLFNDDDAQTFVKTVKHRWEEWLPGLRCTRTTEESMQINQIHGGAIIIAGSGMCTGGRISHHLKNNLWKNNTHLIIVGFQAAGTAGRALVDGTRQLRLFGHEVQVKAHIHTLGGFSAHADQQHLLEWAGHFKPRPKLYLVHGEQDKREILQAQFRQQYDWNAHLPAYREKIEL